MATVYLDGFIRDGIYTPCLNPAELCEYEIEQFDVNNAHSFGLINLGAQGNNLAYSKWVSPKRTRTYPFARIYNTFHLNTKKITVIPIIKDEGAGTQNNDRINFITFSWMSLLDIYIVLAWYEDAEHKPGTSDRITKQILNARSVREKLLEVSQYRMSALHWNTTHFERDFESIYMKAVDGYREISQRRKVDVHDPQNHINALERFRESGRFSLTAFKKATLPRSYAAAFRESETDHALESLEENAKGVFRITNYLGGKYYLTADEIYWDNARLVIQESKNNSRGKIPSESDIKDGLFKLMLFARIEDLAANGEENIPFVTRLKLTGNLDGSLLLPCPKKDVLHFCKQNRLTKTHQERLLSLKKEATQNNKLEMWITGRHE